MTAHETQSPLGHTVWRSLAVVLVLLALVATVAPPVLAVEDATPAAGEEEQEHLTYEQLRQSSSQRAQEFFPEEYEEPSFFQWISIPTLIIGFVIAVAFLAAYLWWQPKFAAERREKERR